MIGTLGIKPGLAKCKQVPYPLAQGSLLLTHSFSTESILSILLGKIVVLELNSEPHTCKVSTLLLSSKVPGAHYLNMEVIITEPEASHRQPLNTGSRRVMSPTSMYRQGKLHLHLIHSSHVRKWTCGQYHDTTHIFKVRQSYTK